MVEFHDKDSFRAWLNGLEQAGYDEAARRAIAVTLAARSALRAAPLYWQWQGRQEAQLTNLGVACAYTISAVAALVPTADIETAAADAATDAAAAATYAAATYATAAHTATFWKALRSDAASFLEGSDLWRLPLWHDGLPSEIDNAWRAAQSWMRHGQGWQEEGARPIPPNRHGFWADFYLAALNGTLRDWNPDLLLEIVQIAAREDIDLKTDAQKINDVLIPEILAKYKRKSSPLREASVFAFRFDKMLYLMRAEGVPGDLKSLQDADLNALLEALEEARDGLQDFLDYAQEARRGSNTPNFLCASVDNLLKELARSEDRGKLRAARLVDLAHQVETHLSRETDLPATLLDPLGRVLDDVSAIFQNNFGAVFERMAFLRDLDLGDLDPNLFLQNLQDALTQIQRVPPEQLVALDPEAQATLQSMVDQLWEYADNTAQISDPEHASRNKKRLGQRIGQTGATLGRYIEDAAQHAQKGRARLEALAKDYKTITTLGGLYKWLAEFIKAL